MAGEFLSGIIFQQTNSWTGSTSSWTSRACSVHRGPTVPRTEGGPRHGGALTGARPVLWRPGDGGEEPGGGGAR
jgi:hypothetical protein